MGKFKDKNGKTRIGSIIKKTSDSKVFMSVIDGVLDVVPAGEPIKKLIKGGEEKKSSFIRIATASIISLGILALLLGKIDESTLYKVLDFLEGII